MEEQVWSLRDTVTLHEEKSWWQQCPCEDGAGALLSRQAQSQEPAMEGWMSQWKLRNIFRCCMARNETREMRISLIIGELLIFKIKTPVDSVLSSHSVSTQNQEFLWWQSGETCTEPHTYGKGPTSFYFLIHYCSNSLPGRGENAHLSVQNAHLLVISCSEAQFIHTRIIWGLKGKSSG